MKGKDEAMQQSVRLPPGAAQSRKPQNSVGKD
jgi:hypothetical protein